jgi:hypothetical protein
MFWPIILDDSTSIFFAYSSFKWRNLAANNAGVTVVIIGISIDYRNDPRLFESSSNDEITEKTVSNINAYIVPGPNLYIDAMAKAPTGRPIMFWGNKPTDGGNLIMSQEEARRVVRKSPEATDFLRPYFGSDEFIKGLPRVCIWVDDRKTNEARAVPDLATKFDKVREFRATSKAKETRPAAEYPHKFRQIQGVPGRQSIIVPIHSSESRSYLPVGLLPSGSIISNAAYGIYEAPVWNLAIIASRIHLVWIATVCGKLETRYRYSNTLGWNTFPIPALTDKNKADLTQCAESILLARETHFPATIADLYDPENMPEDLRAAHERNDEVLERIYIGRRFRNDTERLEKLFELYTKMTKEQKSPRKQKVEA